MLIALQRRFALTKEGRERAITNRQNKLKAQGVRGTDLQKILTDWEKAYADGKKAKVPDIDNKNRPIEDFLDTVPVTEFAGYQKNRLMEMGDKFELDFYGLV